jgi:ribosomal protein S18 acetylase RimI-like enzyme
LLSCLKYRGVAAGSWLLQAISILPEFRGQGHANALLAKAEEEAKGSGAKAITLQVEEINQIALKTYTSNGYAELDRRELIPFPVSQDLGGIILMGKNLGA